jgi:hypothetical protein
MKTIFTLMVTELMLLSISSCNPFETQDTKVTSVMEDRTETHFKIRPKSEDISAHLGMENNPWRGTIFRFTTVSEIDYNQQTEVVLEPENKITGNSYLRKKKIQDFKNEITGILNYTRDSLEQKQSAIFLPVIRELIHLSEMEGAAKELILYSDLKENDSEWFSFYRSSNLKTLQENPDKAVELFLSKVPDGTKFNGVSLHIIYEPLDSQDNKEFRLMINIYQRVFNKLGVPFKISANL